MFLVEEGKFINLLPPVSVSSSAVSAAFVSMANYDHVDFVISFGAVASIASDKVTMRQAINTSGSSPANLAVNGYWYNQAAVSSASIANDTYVRVPKASMSSSGAAFVLTNNSASNQVYIIPVEAEMLNQASSKKAAGIAIATIAGTALIDIKAILSNSRYKAATPPSAL